MEIRSYRDLKVWQKSMRIAQEIYSVTAQFPQEELYGLSGQMRRAAISVPSNIAEGHARDSSREYLRYISITFGSVAELETQITLAAYCGYITEESEGALLNKLHEIGIMLRSLQSAMKVKIDADS